MKSATRLASGWIVFTVLVIAGLLLASPTPAAAQSQGNNAVYYQSGSSGICCQGSGSFIDASMFKSQATDICGVIFYIFTHGYPSSSGTVIDARGLNSSNTTMTCAAGTTPWNNGTTFLSNTPSTILLPAGTIVIPTPWVLPQYAHLIGVGDSIVSASGTWTTSGTTIQACKSSSPSCTFSGDMIDFGGSPACSSCTDISIENLALDGQGQSINGIVNQYSQALT
jgi:hypothetical protein